MLPRASLTCQIHGPSPRHTTGIIKLHVQDQKYDESQATEKSSRDRRDRDPAVANSTQLARSVFNIDTFGGVKALNPGGVQKLIPTIGAAVLGSEPGLSCRLPLHGADSRQSRETRFFRHGPRHQRKNRPSGQIGAPAPSQPVRLPGEPVWFHDRTGHS